MTDLKHLLDRAADDTGRALSTDLDDLLLRARGARRRHRLRTTGTAVVAAALVAAVPLTGTHFGRLGDSPAPSTNPASSGPEQAPSASQTPAVSASTTTAAPLTADVIVERCLPQVANAYRDAATDWVLTHPDRTYAVGEVVALEDANPPTHDLGDGTVVRSGASPSLCVIPEAGHEDEPVPTSAFQPRPTQHELITQLCSQVAPNGTGATVPDLRGAELVAVAADGERVAAVAHQSGRTYACMLDGLTDRRVNGGVHPAADVPLKEVQVHLQATSEGVKSQAVTPTAFYWGAGLLPKGISAIVLDFRDRPDERIPVTDRAYAYLVTQSPAYGLGAFRTKLLDPFGAVRCTSDWSDAVGPGYACPQAR